MWSLIDHFNFLIKPTKICSVKVREHYLNGLWVRRMLKRGTLKRDLHSEPSNMGVPQIVTHIAFVSNFTLYAFPKLT